MYRCPKSNCTENAGCPVCGGAHCVYHCTFKTAGSAYARPPIANGGGNNCNSCGRIFCSCHLVQQRKCCESYGCSNGVATCSCGTTKFCKNHCKNCKNDQMIFVNQQQGPFVQYPFVQQQGFIGRLPVVQGGQIVQDGRVGHLIQREFNLFPSGNFYFG